jgi:hypothetical protein
MLRGLVQCNECRAARPNAQTLSRRNIVARMNAGATLAEAEAAQGVTRRIVIN